MSSKHKNTDQPQPHYGVLVYYVVLSVFALAAVWYFALGIVRPALGLTAGILTCAVLTLMTLYAILRPFILPYRLDRILSVLDQQCDPEGFMRRLERHNARRARKWKLSPVYMLQCRAAASQALGRFDEAAGLYESAQPLLAAEGNHGALVLIQRDLCYLFLAKGERENYQKARQELESFADAPVPGPFLEGAILYVDFFEACAQGDQRTARQKLKSLLPLPHGQVCQQVKLDFHLAHCLETAGKAQEAIARYREAAEKGGHTYYAITARARLAELEQK